MKTSSFTSNLYPSGSLDNALVEKRVNLSTLKKWSLKTEDPIPFYVPVGNVNLLCNGEPTTVRSLIRTYFTQRLEFCVDLVAFLNGEGVATRQVALPIEQMLGYDAQLFHN